MRGILTIQDVRTLINNVKNQSSAKFEPGILLNNLKELLNQFEWVVERFLSDRNKIKELEEAVEKLQKEIKKLKMVNNA